MVLELVNLAQTYTYRTYDSSSSAAGAGVAVAVLLFGLFLAFAFYALFAFSLMKLFQKAGRKDAWAAWVPYYNNWVTAEVAGREGWWGLIPIMNLLAMFDFVRSYGKDNTFAILTIIFPVLLVVMAFDKNTKFVGPAATSSPIAPTQK